MKERLHTSKSESPRSQGAGGGDRPEDVSPELKKVLMDAAMWVTWERGQHWDEAKQAGLKKWLAESELHQFAYRRTAQMHGRATAAIRRGATVDVTAPVKTSRRSWLAWKAPWAVAATVVIALVIGAAGAMFHFREPALATRVGEHRVIALDDGTQVTLNTATRLVVSYNAQQRHVRLIGGEAYFNVAQRADWPFVVTAGDREVTALGTAFVVRREKRHVSVTLVEGKVAVGAVARSVNEKAEPAVQPIVLAPGERLTFREAAQSSALDHPSLDKLTAWRQGVVNIDDMTLGDAVAEMNRYSEVQLVVVGPAADIGVGGVFRSTDAAAFAKAVAITHGLTLKEERGQLVLSGMPGPPTDRAFDRARRAH